MENKNDKTQLLGMTPEELGAFFKAQGQPAFRAKQVFAWLHQGVPFEKMSNLPKALRETLDATCIDNPVSVLETIQSKLDGTIKLLYRLPDNHVIEGVLMRYKYGNTLCLSTQVGCRMGCKFCASTLDGCARSLTPAEMLGQIVCANGILAAQGEGQKVGNIVLMGSGEPFDNYDNVVKFLRILRMEGGLCIGMRSVSLSTCGLVENMRRFAEEDLPVTLSLSLHAPNDEIRRKTMPIANRYSMDEVLSACRAAAKSLSITAATPSRVPSGFSTTGIPPPPQVTTMVLSHKRRTCSISTIFLGSGEATTRRQPRPASSFIA